MAFKFACLLVMCALIGSNAFPAVEEDYSVFFDHTVGRIAGGTTAGSVPHMMALVTGLTFKVLLCGASLITNRHALTAAHCLTSEVSGNNVNSNLRGIVGSDRWNSGGTEVAFSHGIIHPSYRPVPILKNDIGILTASATIKLSNAVGVVALNWNFIEANVRTSVTGWGRTSAGGPVPPVLMELRPTTIDANVCRTEVSRMVAQLGFRDMPEVDPNLEICTFLATNQGTCKGDSGSALIGTDNGQQIAIVSWGLPCALGAPDMFARVSPYRSWIEQNTR